MDEREYEYDPAKWSAGDLMNHFGCNCDKNGHDAIMVAVSYTPGFIELGQAIGKIPKGVVSRIRFIGEQEDCCVLQAELRKVLPGKDDEQFNEEAKRMENEKRSTPITDTV